MVYASDLNWSLIYRLAREGLLPVGVHTIKKVRAGHQRFSDDTCVALHRLTDGQVPCWMLRPDTWQVGQVPPALAGWVPSHEPSSVGAA